MPTPPKPATKPTPPGPDRPSISTDSAGRPSPIVTCGIAWLIPGAGHLLQGQRQKAIVFAVVLIAMFNIGLAFGGRIFSFQISDPLVFLAALAQWTLGAPRLLAAMFGWGPGEVTAATYEAGNTFLIVAGLLNALVALDAFDLASGRKSRLAS